MYIFVNYSRLHVTLFLFPVKSDQTQIEEKSAQKLFYATERVGEALPFFTSTTTFSQNWQFKAICAVKSYT